MEVAAGETETHTHTHRGHDSMCNYMSRAIYNSIEKRDEPLGQPHTSQTLFAANIELRPARPVQAWHAQKCFFPRCQNTDSLSHSSSGGFYASAWTFSGARMSSIIIVVVVCRGRCHGGRPGKFTWSYMACVLDVRSQILKLD